MSGVKGRSGRKGSYAAQLSRALGVIDKELPNLVTKLIEKANNGDREALIYLIDRRLGKPKVQMEVGSGDMPASILVQVLQLINPDRKLLEETNATIKEEEQGENATI